MVSSAYLRLLIFLLAILIPSYASSNPAFHMMYSAAAAKPLQSCPTLQPHRWQPTRLSRPWDSPGNNTGVGYHFLLQCMHVKSESEVVQSYRTLHDPMDYSLPGSSIHGIFQATVLAWVAIAFSPTLVKLVKYMKAVFQDCLCPGSLGRRTRLSTYPSTYSSEMS